MSLAYSGGSGRVRHSLSLLQDPSLCISPSSSAVEHAYRRNDLSCISVHKDSSAGSNKGDSALTTSALPARVFTCRCAMPRSCMRCIRSLFPMPCSASAKPTICLAFPAETCMWRAVLVEVPPLGSWGLWIGAKRADAAGVLIHEVVIWDRYPGAQLVFNRHLEESVPSQGGAANCGAHLSVLGACAHEEACGVGPLVCFRKRLHACQDQ